MTEILKFTLNYDLYLWLLPLLDIAMFRSCCSSISGYSQTAEPSEIEQEPQDNNGKIKTCEIIKSHKRPKHSQSLQCLFKRKAASNSISNFLLSCFPAGFSI